MDRPPEAEHFIHQVGYYWTLLQAEGQGMLVAFIVSIVKVVADSKKLDRRQDIAEIIMTPTTAFVIFKAMVIAGLSLELAVPVGYVIAQIGTKMARDWLIRWVESKFEKFK